MSNKVSVVIESDANGFYAHCPVLPGCQSQGNTMEEAMGNIQEAVELYLETLDGSERSQLLSREVVTKSLEVEVA
jgi:predicted RNase H-like HicB family nuclease